jgi:hypothetical protein
MRLSRPFLGPGYNSSKSYDDNHLPYNRSILLDLLVICDLLVTHQHHPPEQA